MASVLALPSARLRFLACLLVCATLPSGCRTPSTTAERSDSAVSAVSAPLQIVRQAPPTEEPGPVHEPPPDPAAEARRREETERRALQAAFPKQGVVFHFLAQIFAEPKAGARVVGYMRRGTQFLANGPVQGRGCKGGWYAVPGDGFVCRGDGYLIGDEPQFFEPSPAPAALDDALPYAYAKTLRDDVPQYARLPNLQEEQAASEFLSALRAREEAAHPDAGAARASAADPESSSADSVDAPAPPGQTPETSSSRPEEVLPEFLRARMLAGFYVSLDSTEETESGREFFRTVRGGYVRKDALVDASPTALRGVVLGGPWRLPIAFVFRAGVRRLHRDAATDRLEEIDSYDRHTPLAVAEENFVRRNKTYVVSTDGDLVREPSVRLLRTRTRPAGIGAETRWIHVKLSTQTLVAYEGDTPVFATLVSTAKEGFETPRGLFQIMSKHVSTTMDDPNAVDGAYSIEDVPWTMYFQGNFALHGAFWHSSFGQVRSHGCVNLSPVDARWLFSWTTPTLPAGWHGVFSDRRRAGTWVFIED